MAFDPSERIYPNQIKGWKKKSGVGSPEASNVEVNPAYKEAAETAEKGGEIRGLVEKELATARAQLEKQSNELEAYTKDPSEVLKKVAMIGDPELQRQAILDSKQQGVSSSASRLQGLFYLTKRLEHEPDPGKLAEDIQTKIDVLEKTVEDLRAGRQEDVAKKMGDELALYRNAAASLETIIGQAKSG